MATEDTRDIAVEVRTKVEALEKTVSAIETDVKRLVSIVDQYHGVAGVMRLLGFTGLGGAVALIGDNWASMKQFFK